MNYLVSENKKTITKARRIKTVECFICKVYFVRTRSKTQEKLSSGKYICNTNGLCGMTFYEGVFSKWDISGNLYSQEQKRDLKNKFNNLSKGEE